MSSTLFVMDPRVPVDPNADKDNPNHPENVTRKAMMLQRQANADSSYDSRVSIRETPSSSKSGSTVEAFDPRPYIDSIDVRIRIGLFLLLAAVAIAGAVCMRFKTYDFERRIVCAIVAIGAIHYAVAAFN